MHNRVGAVGGRHTQGTPIGGPHCDMQHELSDRRVAMSIDGEAREPKTGNGETLPPNEGTSPTAPRSNRTGMVLGSIAGLLILGGAVYYFADHRAGTEVATGSGSERPAASPTVTSSPR